MKKTFDCDLCGHTFKIKSKVDYLEVTECEKCGNNCVEGWKVPFGKRRIKKILRGIIAWPIDRVKQIININ